MKKLFLVIGCLGFAATTLQAQVALFPKHAKNKGNGQGKDSVQQVPAKKPAAEVIATPKEKKDYSKIDLSNRTADHFMIQYGADVWTNRADVVRTKGSSRHFNFYFMLDKPLKNNKHFSVAYGAGIGSSNIFFDKVEMDLSATETNNVFNDVSNTEHFNKFKLTTIYLQVPVELRYYSNPENTNKSWKFAIGAKAGTLLKAYTKGKDWRNAQDRSLNSSLIVKTQDKRLINGTLLSATARVGYGIVSLHGEYQFTPVLKDGISNRMNRYSIGLAISGL